MFKKIYQYEEISDKIKKAIDIIDYPIAQTMSPMGANVLFEDDKGNTGYTNDGKTIAKYTSVSDPVMDNIIQVIKTGAFKTDREGGDGTSTTVHASSTLTRGGLKLVEEGYNRMQIKSEFDKFGEYIKQELKKQIKQVETDDDKFFIASISANNDSKIAEDVVRIVNAAGQDGLVFFAYGDTETKIVEDTGFNIKSGLFHPRLSNTPGGFSAAYLDCPVLVTDKRIYYVAEAEAILKTVLEAGHKKVCIVARDFIGEAVNYFIANHERGNMQIMMVKDTGATEGNSSTLDDLAVYLGGSVVSEKVGKLTDNLSFNDFVIAKKVFADGTKTIISRDSTKPNVMLDIRIKSIRDEIEKDKDNKELKDRLASLTNGMVSVYIGGRTQLELQERGYRYEDAVNATRNAIKHGYLVGGGMALYNAFTYGDYKADPSFLRLFKQFCECNIRQIAKNCGKDPDTIIGLIKDAHEKTENRNIGYNALTGKIENLIEAGVIDPSKVTELAVDNSISIANIIVSSGYMIVNDREYIEKNNQTAKINKSND